MLGHSYNKNCTSVTLSHPTGELVKLVTILGPHLIGLPLPSKSQIRMMSYDKAQKENYTLVFNKQNHNCIFKSKWIVVEKGGEIFVHFAKWTTDLVIFQKYFSSLLFSLLNYTNGWALVLPIYPCNTGWFLSLFILKWALNLNRHFHKDNALILNKHIKMFNITNHKENAN